MYASQAPSKSKKVDDRTYVCLIKQSVGPVAMKFSARNILVNVIPPRHIELQGEGDIMGTSGKFIHNTIIDLKEEDKVLQISYSSELNITGAAAMLGNKIIKIKAKKLEEEISKSLQERLQKVG